MYNQVDFFVFSAANTITFLYMTRMLFVCCPVQVLAILCMPVKWSHLEEREVTTSSPKHRWSIHQSLVSILNTIGKKTLIYISCSLFTSGCACCGSSMCTLLFVSSTLVTKANATTTSTGAEARHIKWGFKFNYSYFWWGFVLQLYKNFLKVNNFEITTLDVGTDVNWCWTYYRLKISRKEGKKRYERVIQLVVCRNWTVCLISFIWWTCSLIFLGWPSVQSNELQGLVWSSKLCLVARERFSKSTTCSTWISWWTIGVASNFGSQ